MKIRSVELMRDIRHQISLDIQGMAWKEEQEYLASQIKAFESLTKPPPNKTLNQTPVSPRTFGVDSSLRVGDTGAG